MNLSPTTSPKVGRAGRKGSMRRPRAPSHIPPPTQESHENALYALRAYLNGRTCYDTFPISFRIIVLDTKLEVRKALHCLLINGAHPSLDLLYLYKVFIAWDRLGFAGVVSAPLWNSEKSCFAGMFTVNDIIHIIQYYYKSASSIDSVVADVEMLRLESLRGEPLVFLTLYPVQPLTRNT